MTTLNVWLASADDLPHFITATSEKDRLAMVNMTVGSFDMASAGWTLVGTFEGTFIPFEQNVLSEAALRTIDTRIETINAEAGVKLAALRTLRANLLSLPFLEA